MSAKAEWYVTKDGKQKAGPLTSALLKEMARTGQLQPTDMVKREDMSKWAPASKVQGLFQTNDILRSEEPAATAAASGSKSLPTPDPGVPAANPSSLMVRASAAWQKTTWKGRTAFGCLGALVIVAACTRPEGVSDEKPVHNAKKETVANSNEGTGYGWVSKPAGNDASKTATDSYEEGKESGSIAGRNQADSWRDYSPEQKKLMYPTIAGELANFEQQYRDAAKTYGPQNSATLRFKGVMEGYRSELIRGVVIR